MPSELDPGLSANDDALSDALLAGQGLIKRIRIGDVSAFEQLYKSFWSPMYNFAFRYVQSAEESEDVVQEVFFRIWRNRAEWHVAGSLHNYLFIAVRNAAISRLRRDQTARRWSETTVLSSQVSPQLDDPVDIADKHADIERALAEMPQKRRAVCALRWIDDLSYSQISERLGITEKTVENHIGNGVKFMRERLTRD